MHGRLTPSRLRVARQLRGLTQAGLAAEIGISRAAVNQFESGSSQPAANTLERMAFCLKVAPTFLGRPELPAAGRPFFRSLARVPAAERDRASAYAESLRDIVHEIDCFVELPEPLVPRIMGATAESDLRCVEDWAAQARVELRVPSGPIADVVALVEASGVIVAAVGNFHPGIDAFSLPGADRHVMVLCTSKGVATRRRFDAGHELAHLVLHDQRDDRPVWQEQQAHRFASALLMPAAEVADQLPSRGDDLRSAERVAHTWGVSMQAALMRSKDLEILSAEEHGRAMRRLSRLGWRTQEPVEIGPPERPQVLLAAAATLPEAGTSVEGLAETVGLPAGRLRRMLSLPEARDEVAMGELVQFRRGAA